MKKIKDLFSTLILAGITYLPGENGCNLRYRYWKKRLRFLGKGVIIEPGVYFQNPDFIHIDDNCWIDRNVIILAGLDKSSRERLRLKNKNYSGEAGVVFIGKNIHIAPGCIISGISSGVYISDDCGLSSGCKIYAFSHHYQSRKSPEKIIHFGPMRPHEEQCLLEGPVFIGKNTGLALNAVVLPGVSIQKNSFVAINSVVMPGSYPENSMLAGHPAQVTGQRFEKKTEKASLSVDQ